MKYNFKAKIFQIVFKKLMQTYYLRHDLGININDYVKPIKKEYRAIIKRTPALKKGNLMKENLIGASYFFAMAKIIPNMTPALMDDIINESMHSSLMHTIFKKEREHGLMFTDKVQNKMIKAAETSQTSTDEMDWKFTYEKHKDEYYLTFTKCGVCKLAQQENVLEYLPCMCKMDFAKYEEKGAKLERDKTLANNDDCCNFHVTRIKQQNISSNKKK